MADGKQMTEFNLSCPVPRVADDRIVLAHGGGGRLTHQLIEKIFLPAFGNSMLEQRHDGAILPVNGSRLAFTTDSFVVRPLIFPGGNIGDLAIYGTVNDLAMCGARPLYLSAGFILEEGLAMDTLRTVVASMQQAAAKAGVQLVTGDTKVVDRGHGDGIFVNTSGIGLIEANVKQTIASGTTLSKKGISRNPKAPRQNEYASSLSSPRRETRRGIANRSTKDAKA